MKTNVVNSDSPIMEGLMNVVVLLMEQYNNTLIEGTGTSVTVI